MTVLRLHFEIAAATLRRSRLLAVELTGSVTQRAGLISCLDIAAGAVIRGDCICPALGPPARY